MTDPAERELVQIVNSMDSSDDTSQTSSESSSSFWDLVTYAAAIGGYAAAMSSAGPVLNPSFPVEESNGRQWVEKNLLDASRSFDNFSVNVKSPIEHCAVPMLPHLPLH